VDLIKVVVVVGTITVLTIDFCDLGHETHHSISQHGTSKETVEIIKGVVVFVVIDHMPVHSSLMLLLLPGALDSGPSGPWWRGMNRGRRASTSIDGYNGIIGDLALANRALAVVRVDMEPLVEALPAEEMAALGDDRVVGHVKADVALEIGSIAPSLVIRFIVIGISIDIGGRGRRLVVREGGMSLWRTSWLWAAGGGREASLPSVAIWFLRR